MNANGESLIVFVKRIRVGDGLQLAYKAYCGV